ncbi:MinD/ParA family ATP-binding protein [Mycobacterium sp. 050134]|uniref:MinD/ParA family ATP-binding protein n=1 Tax=Mycobacterium sp. 050134 TaxID=3096111 RepID=UPI002ED7EFF7
MGADYDRLFQYPDGTELPEEIGADGDFNVSFPAPAKPPSQVTPDGPQQAGIPPGPTASAAPATLVQPESATPAPPVDWIAPAAPAQPRRQSPPLPIDRIGRHAPADAESPTDRMPAQRSEPAAPPNNAPSRVPEAGNTAHHARHARHARSSRSPRAQQHIPSLEDRSDFKATDAQAAAETAQFGLPDDTPTHPDSIHVPRTARHAPSAVAHIALMPIQKPASKPVPRRGWRRWVFKLTRINLGLSREEKQELSLCNDIRNTPRGSYQIGILGPKGGVGKTSLTVTLGSLFAQLRNDRILAFDADAGSGNLADRVGRQSKATITDLLTERDLSHYNNVRAHLSANAVDLEVLAAPDYSTTPRALSESDWHRAADAVPRFYNLTLIDCGASLLDPVTQGVLSTISAAVIVSSASIDGARQAAIAIDWLRNNGYQDLVGRSCIVINHVAPGKPNVAVKELTREFEKHVQPERVFVLPWDEHIAKGTEIQLDHLGRAYKRKLIQLAAALSADFDRGKDN